MQHYIGLLRGINVGGHRKVPMATLRQLMSDLNFKEVKTYIQSGNIIFLSDEKHTETQLAKIISNAILEEFGFEVPVVVKTADAIKKAVEVNPFSAEPIENLHLTFLSEIPKPEDVAALDQNSFAPDQFIISTSYAYLTIPGKYHKTKISNAFFEKKLNLTATTRNWKTALKLIELIT
ncbi:DUF1697 domain-containing protein [Leeuwenhoekiella polynyae]|uniref:DUF1697 domain-containing protein n=1 Tax=Leeuwenhoekiella polynyae TaxID=1550906 RepID=A0A4Q0PHV6_9FLAO|nr:DUF1697 domain-containing protein [Leeuwenhoekiella polynyae]RXG26158.1 putative protein (DUF1697 family) [Leeuwenhoekiella polynyae]